MSEASPFLPINDKTVARLPCLDNCFEIIKKCFILILEIIFTFPVVSFQKPSLDLSVLFLTTPISNEDIWFLV